MLGKTQLKGKGCLCNVKARWLVETEINTRFFFAMLSVKMILRRVYRRDYFLRFI